MESKMIGHNNPPSQIEQIQADFEGALIEAENWLDGSNVENETQMKAVDMILANVKLAEKAAEEGKELEFRPHKTAADNVSAEWKPFLDDLARLKKGLAGVVSAFKVRLAEEKAQAARKEREEADRLRREAEEKASQTTDIEAQREAAQLLSEAKERMEEAAAIKAEKPKGLRTTKQPEITSMQDVVNWIARNDKSALMAFAEEYVRRNFRDKQISGVLVKEVTAAF